METNRNLENRGSIDESLVFQSVNGAKRYTPNHRRFIQRFLR